MNYKLPRKIKKSFLRYKMSKNKLRKRIENVKILDYYPYGKQKDGGNGYKTYVPNDTFCPNCGCIKSYSSGNKASYPEWWENWYCSRCDKIVAWADNSYPIHILVEIKIQEEEVI